MTECATQGAGRARTPATPQSLHALLPFDMDSDVSKHAYKTPQGDIFIAIPDHLTM